MRKFRFRIGLRSSLILLAVLSIVIAWLARERSIRVKERQSYVLLVEQLDGRFSQIESHGKWKDKRAWVDSRLDRLFGTRVQTVRWQNSKVDDLSILIEFRSLENVFLTNSQLKDITPLAKIESLRALYLDRTNVTNVEPLAKLLTLEHLGISHTGVTNLKPLAQLTNLKLLNLYGVDLPKTEVDTIVSLLPECEVLHDSIPVDPSRLGFGFTEEAIPE